MKVIENENVVCFDCDDTLVLWFSGCDPKDKVNILCPYSKTIDSLKPHKRHIDLLKKYKGRGMTVIVWSAAGYQWAEAVVKALELEDYVDFVQTKPSKYVDDMTAEHVLGSRIYLEDKDEN